MTDDDGVLDAEFYESLSEQISLSGRGPHSAAWPVAIPKTRAVKRDNVTLPLTGEAEQPAQIEILGGDDIPMEKDYGAAPGAVLEVGELGPVDGNNPPARWMLPPYFPGSIGVPQSHASHGSGRRSRQDRPVSRPLCHSRVQCIRHYASNLCFQGARLIVRCNMRLMRTLPLDEGSRTMAFEPLGTVPGDNRKATCDNYDER